ncbi:hypothetical protein CSKR_112514 [Clonorchis sinensis]|uniref:Uncharacterized protein n=1 Tax=Clonorchis sinensis TaxID=79923 RepID=A0A3R7CYJ1_CLOSI|nr:hypothetical protein CSKR_112514 [Clonorchis sinensis]
MPPEGTTRAGILPGCPSLDRGSREAEVGFEPWTFRSRCAAICPCFGGSTGDEEQPRDTHQLEDVEVRRQRQAEAAERRLASTQARGLADPEGVKRKQERAREQEKMSVEHKADTGLRWQVG